MHVFSIAPPLAWARRHWLPLALFLVFAAVSVQYTLKAMESRSAVLRWREQLLLLDGSEDIYQKFTHPNSPIMALTLRPIAELPPLAGALVWFYLKVAMTFLLLHWIFKLVEDPDRPFPLWGKALAVLLSLRPMVGDLSHGNVNLYILFLVAGALYAFRQGRDFLSGVVLALAIASKVTPALFVPYFLWKRAWKSLAGVAAGLVLFVWLVPGLALGFAENAELFTSWRKQMIDPFLFGGQVAYSEHHNQSLPGLVVRLATESPSFTPDDGGSTSYHNLLNLEPKLADWLFVKTAMLAFAGLIVCACRTPTWPRATWRLAAEFSLVVLCMLIFSERTWKHHCVVLVLPFTVLTYYLAACRPRPGLRAYLICTLASVLLLMASTSTSLAGWESGKLAQVYGAYLWAHCLLVIAMAVVLLRREVVPGVHPAPELQISHCKVQIQIEAGVPTLARQSEIGNLR